MDNGCAFHMCPNKEWFQSFKECKRGLVFLGDNKTCEVLGTREIKIKMFDGVVRTLKEVRYVPVLKKNLVSLG